MAEYKVKDGINVHKIVVGFGGIDVNEKMPKKLIDVCIKAGLTEYFEETQTTQKSDGKPTGKPSAASTGSTSTGTVE